MRGVNAFEQLAYGPQNCIINKIKKEKNIKKEEKILKKCENKSIDQRYLGGNEYLKPFTLECNNKYDIDEDPAEYYRKHYKYVTIPSYEDEYMKGSNYPKYNSFMKPQDVYKKIPLDQDVKLPVCFNSDYTTYT